MAGAKKSLAGFKGGGMKMVGKKIARAAMHPMATAKKKASPKGYPRLIY
jgi:hypothetical protein